MSDLLRALVVVGVAAALSAPGPAAGARRKASRPPEKAPESAPAKSEPEAGSAIKRGERIEFDERLMQGQTARAGALYLFDRKPSDLRSMVRERESYRGEIVREIFPDEEASP